MYLKVGTRCQGIAYGLNVQGEVVKIALLPAKKGGEKKTLQQIETKDHPWGYLKRVFVTLQTEEGKKYPFMLDQIR